MARSCLFVLIAFGSSLLAACGGGDEVGDEATSDPSAVAEPSVTSALSTIDDPSTTTSTSTTTMATTTTLATTTTTSEQTTVPLSDEDAARVLAVRETLARLGDDGLADVLSDGQLVEAGAAACSAAPEIEDETGIGLASFDLSRQFDVDPIEGAYLLAAALGAFCANEDQRIFGG